MGGYFIGGWIFHWGLDAFISLEGGILEDGYFIRGWLFHCVDISLGLNRPISLQGISLGVG